MPQLLVSTPDICLRLMFNTDVKVHFMKDGIEIPLYRVEEKQVLCCVIQRISGFAL